MDFIGSELSKPQKNHLAWANIWTDNWVAVQYFGGLCSSNYSSTSSYSSPSSSSTYGWRRGDVSSSSNLLRIFVRRAVVFISNYCPCYVPFYTRLLWVLIHCITPPKEKHILENMNPFRFVIYILSPPLVFTTQNNIF